jgi:hypothetical protein
MEPTDAEVAKKLTSSINVQVAKCTKGGFLIITDHGMSARSTWEEVMECVDFLGTEHLGIPPAMPPDLPAFITKDQEKDVALDSIYNRVKDTAAPIHAALFMVATLASTSFFNYLLA